MYVELSVIFVAKDSVSRVVSAVQKECDQP